MVMGSGGDQMLRCFAPIQIAMIAASGIPGDGQLTRDYINPVG
jgi:hypothetical protein